MTALYLHIPFCRSKCHYCSFQSCAGAEHLHRPYVSALLTELRRLAGDIGAVGGLDTMFIGGGTPTCLPGALLAQIVHTSIDLFGLAADSEISVEANPGTVDVRYLESLLATGVNRLSLGVQSFIDSELAVIGRSHTAAEACHAIEAARRAGFHNINLDLMYGLPGQTPRSWRESLQKAIAFAPQHLSLYQLTIEPDTPFFTLQAQKTISLPAEEAILAMDEITGQLCAAAGLQQYEISNYGAPGYQCRHNINYWQNNDYLAAGASAVSCRLGLRQRRVTDPGEYIRLITMGESAVVEDERLPMEESFRETVIMGLRMVKGVCRTALEQRYGMDIVTYYGPVLDKLCSLGLVEVTATHVRITGRGWPVANQIMAELV